uniref:MADF domain-containing protein n=1 Tax=Dendroctonus ponderosae TaxID=77166 RepID=A0AAR5PH17_DENPD
MEWSEESILNLIATYKSYKILWDPKDQDYFKKERKMDAWNKVCSAVGKSVEACKRKMTSLLASYRKEKNRIKSSMRTAKGAHEVYRSRWFAYKAFRFLEDRHKPRQRLKTEQEIDTEKQIEGDNSQMEEDGGEIQDAQETIVARSPSPTNEMPQKRLKKLQKLLIEDDIGLMTRAESRLKSPISDPAEEVQAFGNYIISKMKSYSEQTRKSVEHAIYDVLVTADRGQYERLLPSTSPTPSLYDPLHVYPPILSPMDSKFSPKSNPSPHSIESEGQRLPSLIKVRSDLIDQDE